MNALRVLVIEDSVYDAELERRVLAPLEAEVKVVMSRFALLRALHEPWDVILTDHALPDLDSMRVISLARNAGLNAPVVVVSGHIGEEAAVKALQAGAADYVAKDRMATLPEVVKRVLQAQRAHEEAEALRRTRLQGEKVAALGGLVAGIAHEINNPLQAMMIAVGLTTEALEAMAHRPDLTPDERLMLEETLRAQASLSTSIDRIATITRSMRRVASPGTGHVTRESPDAVARAVIDVARPRFPPDATIRLDASGTRLVEMDASAFTQVLLAIVLNAADAVAASPRHEVDVALRDEGSEVVIEVADTGPGIPPEAQSHIFEPFFTTKPGGTGLALSLAHRVVTDMGGTISFRTGAHGTTFTIRVPAAPEPGDAAQGAADAGSSATSR